MRTASTFGLQLAAIAAGVGFALVLAAAMLGYTGRARVGGSDFRRFRDAIFARWTSSARARGPRPSARRVVDDLLRATAALQPDRAAAGEEPAALELLASSRASGTTMDAETLKAKLVAVATPKEKLASPNVRAKQVLVNDYRAKQARLQASNEAAAATLTPAPADAPVMPLVVSDAVASRPLPAGRDHERAGPSPQRCRVKWWRGYVTSQFCAVDESGETAGGVIAVSPTFRWRHAVPPPDHGAAADAHAALVAHLEAGGWTIAATGEDWFSVRLRRAAPPTPAPSARANPHEQSEEEGTSGNGK